MADSYSHPPGCPMCGPADVPLPVSKRGADLLNDPRYGKGTAFTARERRELGVEGLLPPHVSTIEEQVRRVYDNFLRKGDPLQQHIYLRALQDRNETLFYAALLEYLEEFMPIIYTPTVARAVEEFSHIFRAARGLYISPDNIDHIDRIFAGIHSHDLAVIVATDNEGILGIGDMGVGGMGIPIGKLALYTAVGGICPASCLPVCLDVGTANQRLIDDPLYLGYSAPRLEDDEYYTFMDTFVAAVRRFFPRTVLQWEDFSRDRAFEVLRRYEDTISSFNDDIQGTAAMVYAATLGALEMSGGRLEEQVFAIVGAGAAGVGIAQATAAALIRGGMDKKAAWERIYVTDSRGLLIDNRPGLEDYKRPLATAAGRLADWTIEGDRPGLYDVVVNARPTVIYGLSGRPGTIDERSVRAMSEYCKRPIIFPLSNPTANCDALPEDLLHWSEGRAIVATGSPFDPVRIGGREIHISQANNVCIFPGVGLGAYLCGAERINGAMLSAAGEALHVMTEPVDYARGEVLPPRSDLRETAVQVARAVAEVAWETGLAHNSRPEGDLVEAIGKWMWQPVYRSFVPA